MSLLVEQEIEIGLSLGGVIAGVVRWVYPIKPAGLLGCTPGCLNVPLFPFSFSISPLSFPIFPSLTTSPNVCFNVTSVTFTVLRNTATS